MTAFVLLLALLTAFPPLATDMYLPAIPLLVEVWNQPLSIVNLTLVLFFVTYCVSLLIYGPLSDRFGRKPPLISGLLLFILASLLCAFSGSISMLIGARILQGMGAGAASAISLAMARDKLESGIRERVLSQVSVIMAIAPMVSPMIGSIILEYTSWPWIFICQGIMGGIALLGVVKTPETHPGREAEGASLHIQRYVRVLGNYRLMGVVACNAAIALPLFAFIASSSFIYISTFQMSETLFAVFFGANACCFMAGAMTCMRFGKKIGTLRMITAGYTGVVLGGLLMFAGILGGPWQFAIPMGMITFSLGLSRPPSNNLALEQVSQDAGTASSTMVFSYFICGALAMLAVSLDWSDKIDFTAILATSSGLFSLLLWLILKNHLWLTAK
ncbi:MAG: multidrug effflux MFS transporter [Desulfocapsa sp.]|nr:multidrug effflux MFS transporter [Desulfocapsa sp.]